MSDEGYELSPKVATTPVTLREWGDERLDSFKAFTKQRIDDFRDLVNHELAARDKLLDALLTASQDAIRVASEAQNKRLEGMNEFRQTLDDQVRTFLTREVFDRLHERLEADVDAITTRMTQMDAQAAANFKWTAGIAGLVGAATAAFFHFIH